MRVLPTSGASTIATTASAPKTSTVDVNRRRIGEAARGAATISPRPGKWHHRQMTRARMKLHVGVDVVEPSNAVRGQRALRGTLRDDPSFLEHDDSIAH